MKHPGQDIVQEIRARSWTQKHFSQLLGKKVSEVNELIKGKRNITIQRDLILSKVLGSPEKFRMNKQIDYDYVIAKQNFDDSKIKKTIKQKPEVTKQHKQYPQESKNKEHEGIFKNF